MTLSKFPECNATYAANQPPYKPLPALKANDANGSVICCWKLSWRERLRLLFTGKVWHCILTFNQPLQPQLLTTIKPFSIEE
jgi:hypothetical protein